VLEKFGSSNLQAYATPRSEAGAEFSMLHLCDRTGLLQNVE
jgi:hypothetical protein